MKINVWLRECVYKRVTPKGKKPGFAPSVLRTRFDFLGFGILLCRSLSARMLRAKKGAGKANSGTTTPVGDKTFMMPPLLDSVMPRRIVSRPI